VAPERLGPSFVAAIEASATASALSRNAVNALDASQLQRLVGCGAAPNWAAFCAAPDAGSDCDGKEPWRERRVCTLLSGQHGRQV
jgi:hypothetical protein